MVCHLYHMVCAPWSIYIVMSRSEAGVIEMNGGAESKDGEDEREEETRHILDLK